MSGERPFLALGNCLRLTATQAGTAAAVIPVESGPLFASATLRIFNGSASVGFFRTGDGTVTATMQDTFIAPGSTEVFVLPKGHTHIAAILEAGAGYVYVQRGGGV